MVRSGRDALVHAVEQGQMRIVSLLVDDLGASVSGRAIQAAELSGDFVILEQLHGMVMRQSMAMVLSDH